MTKKEHVVKKESKLCDEESFVLTKALAVIGFHGKVIAEATVVSGCNEPLHPAIKVFLLKVLLDYSANGKVPISQRFDKLGCFYFTNQPYIFYEKSGIDKSASTVCYRISMRSIRSV